MTKKILFTCLFVLVTSVCLAKDESLVTKLCQNQESCLKELKHNKLYLNESQIFPTEKGIVVVLNTVNESLVVPTIHSDNGGCYIELSVEELRDALEKGLIFSCEGCAQNYLVYCRNAVCPLKRKVGDESPRLRQRGRRRSA